jgi:hypothetical protein
MASALTGEQRWALIMTYGSIDNARDEAIGRSLELQELWQSQFTGDWGRGSGFEEVFWARALPVLGIDTMPTAPAQSRGPGRQGTDYLGSDVEEIVRLAHAAQTADAHLGRTLRNQIAAEAKVTPYEVDLVFELMRAGKLADAGREGWLTIDGELSATPNYINLHELKTRS